LADSTGGDATTDTASCALTIDIVITDSIRAPKRYAHMRLSTWPRPARGTSLAISITSCGAA
jgi:hypothetical protein